jgi:hypothetical protein
MMVRGLRHDRHAVDEADGVHEGREAKIAQVAGTSENYLTPALAVLEKNT